MDKRICIFIPYFGKFPQWFDLYLYSCSHVKNVNFYYFTDCIIPDKIYSNTKFIPMTFKEYCELVSNELNTNFYPSSPYSLCNIRPFMGTIHHDIARKYDFWGYADVDLIYGNISELLSDSNLNKYDLITTHSERVAGHFTIIRRNSKYDKKAFEIKNWKQVIVNKKSGVDEGEFSQVVYPLFIIISRLWRHIFSRFMPQDEMYYFYQKAHNLFKSKALFIESYTSPIPKKDDFWVYNLKTNEIKAPKRFYDKKFLNKRSLPYLHFLFFKKTPYLKTKNYWSPDFYKIPKNYNFDKDSKIIISTNGIELLDDDR